MHRDPAHREWNDIRNALKQSGCQQLVLELTFTFNTPYGPWEGGKWHKSNQSACKAINSKLSKDDFLISTLREWILLDRGIYTDVTECFSKTTAIDQLLDPADFANKGKKISLTRWFDFFGRLEERLPQWHSLFLVMLFQGIFSGVIKSRDDFPSMLSSRARGSVQPWSTTTAAPESSPTDPANAAGDLEIGEAAEPEPDPTEPLGTAADLRKVPTGRDSVNNLRQKCPTLSPIACTTSLMQACSWTVTLLV